MPKWLHDKLAREADEKGLTGDRKNAYVYGTLNKVEKSNKTAKAVIKHGRKKKNDSRS